MFTQREDDVKRRTDQDFLQEYYIVIKTLSKTLRSAYQTIGFGSVGPYLRTVFILSHVNSTD